MATQLSAKARVTGLLLGLSGLFLGTQLWRAAAHEAAETCMRIGAVGHAAPMAVNAGDIPALEDVR